MSKKKIYKELAAIKKELQIIKRNLELKTDRPHAETKPLSKEFIQGEIPENLKSLEERISALEKSEEGRRKMEHRKKLLGEDPVDRARELLRGR